MPYLFVHYGHPVADDPGTQAASWKVDSQMQHLRVKRQYAQDIAEHCDFHTVSVTCRTEVHEAFCKHPQMQGCPTDHMVQSKQLQNVCMATRPMQWCRASTGVINSNR